VSSKHSPRYRIQAVAQRTGVAAATLRAWERRYGIPTPVRTDTAYRTYSDSDVELVQEMCRLCSSGLSPAEAANLLKERAQNEGSDRLTEEELVEVVGSSEVSDIHEAVVRRIVAAVRSMSIGTIEAELIHARGLGSGLRIFEKVLRPALETIGQLWHDGEISIGHEHLATEMITATARDLLRLAQPSDTQRLALLACFADEAHTAPLYGTGLRLAGWGCRVAILGALTPPAALAPAVKRLKPTLVGLSVTITPPKARARELLEGYATACGDVPWLVGGQAAASLEGLIREVGGAMAPSTEEELQQLLDKVLDSAGKRDRRSG
jgi:MerR family transcriptional regulator, light-induced transcriptional regulator